MLSYVLNVHAFAALNDAGDIVTTTRLDGPGVTDAHRMILWMRQHVLRRWLPLLRSGDEVAGRVVCAERESDLAGYCAATGADGQGRSLNDSGMLAIRLEFTDGSQGVFRIGPPVFGDADGDGELGTPGAPGELGGCDAWPSECPRFCGSWTAARCRRRLRL